MVKKAPIAIPKAISTDNTEKNAANASTTGRTVHGLTAGQLKREIMDAVKDDADIQQMLAKVIEINVSKLLTKDPDFCRKIVMEAMEDEDVARNYLRIVKCEAEKEQVSRLLSILQALIMLE